MDILFSDSGQRGEYGQLGYIRGPPLGFEEEGSLLQHKLGLVSIKAACECKQFCRNFTVGSDIS